jgi:hypothetical protein
MVCILVRARGGDDDERAAVRAAENPSTIAAFTGIMVGKAKFKKDLVKREYTINLGAHGASVSGSATVAHWLWRAGKALHRCTFKKYAPRAIKAVRPESVSAGRRVRENRILKTRSFATFSSPGPKHALAMLTILACAAWRASDEPGCRRKPPLRQPDPVGRPAGEEVRHEGDEHEGRAHRHEPEQAAVEQGREERALAARKLQTLSA